MQTQSEQQLPRKELHVLSVLADAPLHGYGLVKAIETKSNGSVVFDPANLYRTLRRMCELGWIREQKQAGYTRRRTYEITNDGRAVLRDELQRLQQLIEQLRPAKVNG